VNGDEGGHPLIAGTVVEVTGTDRRPARVRGGHGDHPAMFSWRFLGSLPGLGALTGAILAPILYARAHRS
jgi:hypothetical protein